MQCGGNLERQAIKKAWLCPYCGARYEEEEQEKTRAPKEYCGLNEEVFEVESDLSKIMKERNGAGVIHSIVRCMRTIPYPRQKPEPIGIAPDENIGEQNWTNRGKRYI